MLRRHLPPLLVLLALAAALRLPQLTDSLWLDEQHTAWTIRDGIQELAPRATMGNYSPLYFFLPWLSTRWLGWHEVGLRLPSLLAGLALPLMLYAITVRWVQSRSAALAAGFLAAIDPNFLFYSLEARPYSILQLLSVLQVALFVAWCLGKGTWKLSWLWSMITLLMFYLHFTSLLLPVAELVVLLCLFPFVCWRDRRNEDEESVRPRLSIQVRQAAAVTFILVIGCAFSHQQLRELFLRRAAWNAFVEVPSLTGLLTVFPIGVCCGVPMLLAGMAHAASRWCRRRTEEPNHDSSMSLNFRLVMLAGLFFVGLGLAWTPSRFDLARIFYRRYLMSFSTLPILFCGVVLASIESRTWRRLAAVTTGVVALVVMGPFTEWQQHGHFVRRGREDWRSAIAFMQQATPFPVLVRSGLIESDQLPFRDADRDPPFAAYCCLPVLGMYDMPDWSSPPIPLPRSRPWEYFRREIEPALPKKAWLMVRGNLLSVPNGWLLEQQHHFGSVQVWLLARE